MKKLVAENSFWELFPDAAIGILAVESARRNGERMFVPDFTNV